MKRVRVIKPHASEFPNPIKVSTGASVSVEDKATLWPGWIWCRAGGGSEGWIPSSYVKRDGDFGVVKRDYDASELTVVTGDVLEVIDEESSWLQCQTETGSIGWVPLENVEVIE